MNRVRRRFLRKLGYKTMSIMSYRNLKSPHLLGFLKLWTMSAEEEKGKEEKNASPIQLLNTHT